MKIFNVILILGGGLIYQNGHWQSTGFHGPVFGSQLRVLAGSYLFSQNLKQVIIASGGKGYLKDTKNAPAVGAVVARELIALQVPKKNIIEENRSNNTYQQLRNFKKLLLKYDFTHVRIISNKYHLARVKALIGRDLLLKNLLRKKIQLLSAESIVIKYNPEMKTQIKKLYASLGMKEVLKKERDDVRQINNGIYDFKQNTSRSHQYI